LGLKYNLLTAYTSFVAIDNEVRNKDGKPTTVKQPLPLPQGVSDYAVGGCMAEAMQKVASAPCLERERVVSKEELKDKKAQTPTIRVESITAVKGMTEADISTVAESHLDEIKDCVIAFGGKEKVTLFIAINPDGKVKTVSIATGTKTKNIDTQCLTKKMKTWQFPANKKGNEMSTTITLVFES